jgi:hypothetical protein
VRNHNRRREDADPGTQSVETEVTRMQLKSVEVGVDGGPWQAAALEKSSTRFSRKLFTFDWEGGYTRRTHWFLAPLTPTE